MTAQIGRTREKINFENPNYKQDLVESQSIFSDNINKSYYFKINKKQDLNVFKQYVIEQLNTYITILENAITKRGIESNALQNIDIIISYNESNVNVEDFKRIF